MDYNLLSPEVQANPFPYYAHLRRHTPVLWSEPLQAWLISRYHDVDYAISNPQLFSSAGWLTAWYGDLNPVPEVSWMLELDPPAHTRVRKLANKAFTPRLIKALEPRLRSLVQELLALLPMHQEFDFMQKVATPLPLLTIAELLGIDRDRRDAFKRWSNAVFTAADRPTDERERQHIRTNLAEMRAYFTEAIAQRRSTPREDLITAFVRAEEDQQLLSADEILALMVLLLSAGHESVTNSLGSAIMTLLEHPAALATVRADRTLVPALIEEVLRYERPSNSSRDERYRK